MKRFTALLFVAALCAALLCGCAQGAPVFKSAVVPGIFSSEEAAKAPELEVAEPETQATEPTQASTTPTATQPTEPATQPATTADGSVVPSWFDDAVFIGDSITTTLDFLCSEDESLLGDAQFVCADSLGFNSAQWDLNDPNNVHPTYRGEKVLAETAAKITGAKKVFILLGANDLGTWGIDDTKDAVKSFTAKLFANSPNVELYFQSTTPMITEKESDYLNNDDIVEFDKWLKEYCDQNGYHYIDLYSQLCDETGALRIDYCDDPDYDGIHFTTGACNVWANYLKYIVANPSGDRTPETTVEPTYADPYDDTNGDAYDDTYGDTYDDTYDDTYGDTYQEPYDDTYDGYGNAEGYEEYDY